MTEREYPRWVNRRSDGVGSVIAETAEEEASILARWAAEDQGATEAPKTEVTASTAAQQIDADALEKAWCDGIVSALEAAREAGVPEEQITLIRSAFDPKVTERLASKTENALTQPEGTKARGGWPKGKPRGKRPSVSVN